jgi:membrane associated rhomboid family serine protease
VFPLRDSIIRTHQAYVVWGLIALNVVVFAYQLTLSQTDLQAFLMQHALVPRRYSHPGWGSQMGLSALDVTPLLTNTFLHGGFLHIISNMWTLYIFGPSLEDRLGPGRFLALYLIAGVAASATHAVFNANSPIPALGASGAIAGVIGAYAVRFPYAWVRVLVLIVIFPLFFDIPAVLFAGFWFFMQVMQGAGEFLMPSAGGGIAWWAHIGGFLTGLFLLPRIRPEAGTPGPWGRWTPDSRLHMFGPTSPGWHWWSWWTWWLPRR